MADSEKKTQHVRNKHTGILICIIVLLLIVAAVVFVTVLLPTNDNKSSEAFIAQKAEYRLKGDEHLAAGNKPMAAVMYTKAGEPVLAKRVYDFSTKIAAMNGASLAVTESGSVLYLSNDESADKTMPQSTTLSHFIVAD